jgi:hypothetical protein
MDEQAETTEKRSPGRPKGAKTKPKPPPVRREPLHRGAHRGLQSDTALVDYVYNPDLPSSPFDIDPTIIAGIWRDYEFAVEWHVQEVAGKVMDRYITQRARNRWAPVRKGNFGGALDHLCDRDGYVRREGQLLEGLPIQFYKVAKAHQKHAADDAPAQMKRSHAIEGVPVEGGRHESALRHNKHRQTFEKIDIPE